MGCLLLMIVLGATASTHAHADPPAAPRASLDDTVQSILSLSWLLNGSLTKEQIRKALGRKEGGFWLQDVKAAGAGLNMKLHYQKLTLEALRQRGGPALLGLRGPDQMFALAAVGPQNSIIYDAGRTEIVANAVLEKRFSGEAVFLDNATGTWPQLQVEDPVRVVQVRDDEPEQAVKVDVSNRGSEPLEVGIEAISCGCTGGDYATQTLAGRGNTVLDFAVSAQGDRTVIVTLRSSDPLWPRVMMAFQIEKVSGNPPL